MAANLLVRKSGFTYISRISNFVGPTDVLVSGNTLQIPDYSKTDWQWTLFDPEAKKKRHEEVFPQECRKAFEMGAVLLQNK